LAHDVVVVAAPPPPELDELLLDEPVAGVAEPVFDVVADPELEQAARETAASAAIVTAVAVRRIVRAIVTPNVS
jgi:hypothetical protein